MPDSLSPARIIDRLSQLLDHARALEMAINGSNSIEPIERNALDRLAELIVDTITTLRDEVDTQRKDKRQGEQ